MEEWKRACKGTSEVPSKSSLSSSEWQLQEYLPHNNYLRNIFVSCGFSVSLFHFTMKMGCCFSSHLSGSREGERGSPGLNESRKW